MACYLSNSAIKRPLTVHQIPSRKRDGMPVVCERSLLKYGIEINVRLVSLRRVFYHLLSVIFKKYAVYDEDVTAGAKLTLCKPGRYYGPRDDGSFRAEEIENLTSFRNLHAQAKRLEVVELVFWISVVIEWVLRHKRGTLLLVKLLHEFHERLESMGVFVSLMRFPNQDRSTKNLSWLTLCLGFQPGFLLRKSSN